MTHRITHKLILYFTIVLLSLAAVVGTLFFTLYSEQTARIYRTELENRAVHIAETLSVYFSNEPMSGPENMRNFGMQGKLAGQAGGMGMYLRFIDDIAMSDVWIVDRDARSISVGSGKNQVNLAELPAAAQHLLDWVFQGETAFSESFSPLLENPSITVGAPVFAADGAVFAAVLLHNESAGIADATRAGVRILSISLAAALLLSGLLSMILARRFIRPLHLMNRTTHQMAAGNYGSRTEIRQQDEIGMLAQNIDILAERLQRGSEESGRLEQMRRDFITTVSHELRTPVTVLRGSLEALHDGVVHDPSQVQAYYSQMLSESIHLERIINDLLELSRLQNPDFKITKTLINLPGVLEDSIRAIRPIANAKTVSLQYQRQDCQHPFSGDYGRLRQMFLIILDNAVKFSAENGSVEIEVLRTGAAYRVMICDHGTGIAPVDLPHIFDRFYNRSGSANHCGTGLGLSIAKEIADRHQVEIQAESEPLVRTCFTFLFPESSSTIQN